MRIALFCAAVLVLVSFPSPLRAQGADACSSAEEISGYGTFSWNNTSATTDGQDHGTGSLCGFDGTGNIIDDIWFCWEAAGSGHEVELFDCPGSLINSKVAIYGPFASCAAATSACAPPTGNLVTCDDDVGCGGGLQSTVSFTTPTAGQAYLIRYGRSPNSSSGNGSGTFTLNSFVFSDDFESGNTNEWSTTEG